MNKKSKKPRPSITDELQAIQSCLDALSALDNISAEIRVLEYLLNNLKSDPRRYLD